jgi:hypothetical protein
MNNLKTHQHTHTLGSIHALISGSYLRKHRHIHMIIINSSQRNEISSASAIPSLLVQMI